MKTNTQRWVKGLVSSIIQGGAGAVASSGTTAVIAPDQFNPMKQLGHFVELGCAVFVLTGLLHLMMFLQQHPLPDDTTFITNPQPNTSNTNQ